MIEHEKEQQLTKLQSQQNEQQNENDVFESVSGESAVDEQEHSTQPIIQNNQHFTLIPLTFPPPDKHTMHLIQLYQQNSNQINQLKQQISRLSQIKRGNLFIKYDSVKMNFQQQQSQFFLSSQAVYNERQEELEKIKREIRGVDREQLTAIMFKNQHIFNLAQGYFQRFRTVIEGDIYGEELVVLTEEKRKMHRRRRHNIEDEVAIEKLTKSNSCSRSGIKRHHNNSQQKNTTNNVVVQQQRVIRNQSQRSDTSENKTPTSKRHEKSRRQFNLRFLHLSHLFPSFQSSQIERGVTCYTLGEKSQSVPRSFVMDSKKEFVLVLYSTNVIVGYYFRDGSQEEIRDELLSSSHRSNHEEYLLGGNNHTLREIPNFSIQLDLNCHILFFSLRKSHFYLLTSDGVLRVYNISFDSLKKQLTSSITNVLYCLINNQPLGDIQHVAFNSLNNDEILFTTSTNKLCKVSLLKYKAEVVRKYHQKLVYMNKDYIETEDSVCVNYCKQSERMDILKEEMVELFSKSHSKDLFKTCTLLQGNQIHFVKINKHGLLTGYSKDLQ